MATPEQQQRQAQQLNTGIRLANTIKNWNDAPARPIVGSQGGAPIGGGLAEGAGAAAGGEAAGAGAAAAAGGEVGALAELAPLALL